MCRASLFLVGCLAAMSFAPRASATGLNLLVSEYFGGKIDQFASNGSSTTWTNQGSVHGIAISSGLVATTDFSGTVTVYNAVGAFQTSYAMGSNLQGITFDNLGNMYAADVNPGVIWKLASGDTIATVFASGLNLPREIAFDSTSNSLFVSEQGNNDILKFNLAGAMTLFANLPGTAHYGGLAVDAAGKVFAVSEGNAIYGFLPGGTSGLVTNLYAESLGIDASGRLFASQPVGGSIIEVFGNGTTSTFASGINSPTEFASPSSGTFVWAPAGAETPEPTVLSTLGLGIAGLVALRRRKTRR